MKQWGHDLIHLASAMPTTPDPSFNESLNFLRLVHNGQWDQLKSLDWSALDTNIVFSLALNVLKPEALLSTPFDWLSPKDGASPLVRLLTAQSLHPFLAQDHDSTYSRAEYIARKFWENPKVQKAFAPDTKVVVDNRVRNLGDVALEWNASCASHFLNREWTTVEDKNQTWAAFFKMVSAVPLPSFTVRDATSVFENADKIFDHLPSGNPFGSEKVNVALLQLAFKAIVSVADNKLEEQSLNRMSSDQKPMAIEMEEFTVHVSQYIAQTLNDAPQLWHNVLNAPLVDRNPLATRVVLGMVFQNMDDAQRKCAVGALVDKVVETNAVMWAKVVPTHPSVAVPLLDEQIKSIINVCTDYFTINWACKTLAPLGSVHTQEKLKQIHQLNQQTQERNLSADAKARIKLDMTCLIASFGNTTSPKTRKI